jgi:hypothetical protein
MSIPVLLIVIGIVVALLGYGVLGLALIAIGGLLLILAAVPRR